jgi:hypothetical protein
MIACLGHHAQPCASSAYSASKHLESTRFDKSWQREERKLTSWEERQPFWQDESYDRLVRNEKRVPKYPALH